MTDTWPDVEGGLRAYLRADANVAALVHGRVFFGIPAEPRFPLLTVTRVGGGEDISPDAPVDVALMEVQVWGEGRNKAEATALLNAVRSALFAIRSRTNLTTGVDAFGATVAGVTYLPDPADDRPRYIVTAQVTAIAA
jgi:hypothetical protein